MTQQGATWQSGALQYLAFIPHPFKAPFGPQEAGVILSPMGRLWPAPQGGLPYAATGHCGVCGLPVWQGQAPKARRPLILSLHGCTYAHTTHTCK